MDLVHLAVIRLTNILKEDFLSLKSYLEKTHHGKNLFAILNVSPL